MDIKRDIRINNRLTPPTYKRLMKALSIAVLLFLLSIPPLFAQSSVTLIADEWPPYQMYQKNKKNILTRGFCLDVITAVFKTMNVAIEQPVKIYPWLRAIKMTRNGEVTGQICVARNQERTEYAYFPSEPLFTSPWVYFIRRGEEPKFNFDSFHDLKKKTVGIVRSFVYTTEFWRFLENSGNYEETTSNKLLLKMLANRRIDYMITDKQNGLYQVRQLGLEKRITYLPGKQLEKIALYLMFSKKRVNRSFVNRFSEELKRFKTTKEYRQIYYRYLHPEQE